jgi:NTP pyrophosphatase (non-canonical NTP hydrolase)
MNEQKVLTVPWILVQMKLSEYQKWVKSMWSSKNESLDLRDHFIMTVGLAGETGEVMEILKKNVRNGVLDKDHLTEELGDVLYYLTMICTAHGITLEDVMATNIKKLNERYKDRK